MYVSFLMKGDKMAQAVVSEKYMNEDGQIHAYPYQRNSQYLSESLGLYMNYLCLVRDQQGFEEQYMSLVNHFIVQKDEEYYINWVLQEGTTVNALIDDIRIIDSLNQAGEIFHEEKYRILAEQLLNTIRTRQIFAGLYTDFYDWSLDLPASRITLSYMTSEFFQYLPNAERNKQLFKQIKRTSIFFPEYFDLQKNQWVSAEEAHMVDQLLIALNMERSGIEPYFKNWVIAEWKAEKMIYGRYDKQLLQPTVSHESLAVYYYLYNYFLEIKERKLAREVFERAEQLASLAAQKDERHFFDFIQFELMRIEEEER